MRRWGEQSARPEAYWQPFLGELGLRPSDLGELTPHQLNSCLDYAKKRGIIG